MGFKSTGDPEMDKLFLGILLPDPPEFVQKPKKEPLTIEVPAPEIVAISDEPVKTFADAVQNSGIKKSGKKKRGRDTVLVPVLSQAELERNTPANGKGMTEIETPRGITVETFLLLLSNAYALYVSTGAYDNDSLQRRTGMAPGTISRCIASPEFKRALSYRGVIPNATGLTREQDLVLLALTDPADGRTLQQKLRACGITYAVYRGWMKQATFKAQMEAYTEGTLADNSAALVQLDKLAGMGDLGAIKFKLELNGRYDPTRQQNIDVIAMMSMMMDIISRNVKDQEQLSAISTEFGELASKLRVKQIGA